MSLPRWGIESGKIGGMAAFSAQRRTAASRRIGPRAVTEPRILLLDEPFSNLDATLSEQMQVEVKLLRKRLQPTL
jgi:iron(III) transport system ATP-binding protein